MVLIFRTQLVFPNPENSPTVFAKGSANKQITSLVCREFVVPESRIVLGQRPVLWATMPEAAVHKHGNALLWKHEIGLAEFGLISSPSGNLVRSQQAHQCLFCAFVPAPPDA
jgi:hypothetical protein